MARLKVWKTCTWRLLLSSFLSCSFEGKVASSLGRKFAPVKSPPPPAAAAAEVRRKLFPSSLPFLPSNTNRKTVFFLSVTKPRPSNGQCCCWCCCWWRYFRSIKSVDTSETKPCQTPRQTFWTESVLVFPSTASLLSSEVVEGLGTIFLCWRFCLFFFFSVKTEWEWVLALHCVDWNWLEGEGSPRPPDLESSFRGGFSLFTAHATQPFLSPEKEVGGDTACY